MNYDADGLSKRERALLSDWERARKKSVSLNEIGRAVGEPVARMVASTLVRKGVLDRIRPGLYAVRPFRAMARPWALPSLVAVELLLAGERHYIGGLAAFTVHRLTQQQYASVVDAFTTSFRRPRRLGEAEIRFHRRKPSLFGRGLTTIDIDGTQVVVSDPERTVLDALEEPHIVGGMHEAKRLFDEAVPRLDHARLATYALDIARGSTCQRLGLLLERHGIGGSFMDDLRTRAARPTGVYQLIPGDDDCPATPNPVWHVIENDRPCSGIPTSAKP
jgi:predicted transcriptional regulator of viral defense system